MVEGVSCKSRRLGFASQNPYEISDTVVLVPVIPVLWEVETGGVLGRAGCQRRVKRRLTQGNLVKSIRT